MKELEKKMAHSAGHNSKAFYNYANNKLKTRVSIADLDTDSGKAITDIDKAETLIFFFSAVFTREDFENFPNSRQVLGIQVPLDNI